MEVFMKIKAGVVGYGNLGKAVEKELLLSPDYQLIQTFSRRDIPHTLPYRKLRDYEGEIDLLFLCGGSQNELETQALSLLPHFSIAESYDNHARLKPFHNEIDKIAKEHGKIALSSLGWDPGLFSYMRALFTTLGLDPYTFWGPGLSQGHTQAIKNINGVVDGLQFTVPLAEGERKAFRGESLDPHQMHKRICYVVANPEDRPRIEEEIKSMPDYFVGYPTEVLFVKQEELEKLKSFAHQGKVTTKNSMMNFSLNLPSNPEFTAKVLTTFAKNYLPLKERDAYGAYTIMDLPLKNILSEDEFEFM